MVKLRLDVTLYSAALNRSREKFTNSHIQSTCWNEALATKFQAEVRYKEQETHGSGRQGTKCGRYGSGVHVYSYISKCYFMSTQVVPLSCVIALCVGKAFCVFSR